MSKKKEFLFVISHKDLKKFYTIHELLINELAKSFIRINFLIYDNLILFQKKENIKIKPSEISNYPKNSNFIIPKDATEYMSKIRSDYYVGLLNLGKYFRFFKIHYLIRKKNIKLITVSNIGFIPDNKNFVTFKFWYYLRDLFRRHFVFKLFKLLTIINIFPRVDVRFISNLNYQISSLNSLSGKLNKFFKTKVFDYYEKYIKVNAKIFDQGKLRKKILRQKYITFIDTNLEHETKIEYEGKFDKKRLKIYYQRLNNFLFKLERIFNKRLIICVHPNYSLQESKRIYKKFKVVKYQTEKYIREAFLCVGFSSSSIIDAIFLKKRILILDSILMGKHHNDTNKIYPNAVNVLKLSIDNEIYFKKIDLLNELNKRIKNYEKFTKKKIKVDKNTIGVKKISNFLKYNYKVS